VKFSDVAELQTLGAQDRAVQADDVSRSWTIARHHDRSLDLELDAERSEVPRAPAPPIDLARREDEPAPLART